jgi:hypothetical protein
MENVPIVTIELDKPRHLKLTLGGMKRFQEVTGKSLLKGFNMAEMSENDLIAFIWACLIWEDKNLSLEDFGFMLDFSRLNEIQGKLAAALTAGIPKSTESPNPPANPPLG